jgi:tripartite-type tricarboxylate transporter receptor subunit TctC
VPPGSPPDLVARIIADQLTRQMGRPVIVENHPGANQTIGLAIVAAAARDGNTLGMVSLPTVVVPNIVANMPFDTLRDFAPVRELVWTSNVLVVASNGNIQSVPDLVAKAKRSPGKLTFASGGNGTPAHIVAELFQQDAGVVLVHVPFRGAAEGVAAVMGGHVDLMFASAGVIEPYVQASKLKALAQTTGEPLPQLGGIPTLRQLGFASSAVRDWQGIVAPAGTPTVILQQLSEALGKAVQDREVRERFYALDLQVVTDSNPEAFREVLRSELARWAAVARAAHLHAD